MRRAARVIIVDGDRLLLMHRNKFGLEYDVLIGGGVEITETPEQALLREISEEVGVKVNEPRLVFIEQAPAPYGTQYVFLCKYLSGEAKLSEQSIETKLNANGKNLYMPMWRKISEFQSLPFRSESLKKAILAGFKSGFPSQPIDITNL